MSKGKSNISMVCTIFKIAFGSAPVSMGIVMTAGFLHSVFFVLQTVFTQRFFDAVTVASISGQPVRAVYGMVQLVLVVAGVHIFTGLHNAMIEVASMKVTKAMYLRLQDKASHMAAEFFEKPENLEAVEKAKSGVEQSAFFVNICLTVITYYIPYFMLTGIYLTTLKPIFFLVIGLVFVPVCFSQIIRQKAYSKLEDDAAVYRRKYTHYEACIRDREYFKETRMLGAYPYFYRLFTEHIKMHDSLKWRAEKHTGFIELGMKCITLSGYLGILFLFIHAVINREISLGAFAAILTAIQTMFRVMEELICGHIGRLSQNFASIRNYIQFLSMQEDTGEYGICSGNGIGIDLEEVCFKYPGSDISAIEELTLHIRPGESVAVVGENGSGKTTLMKLLCGQYLPVSGRLLVNHIDSRMLKKDSYSREITAVFQDYQRYALTLADNVCIADEKKAALKRSRQECFERELKKLLLDCGLDADAIEGGLSAVLSREFGGTGLSGGQWQKTAIARADFKDGSLLILDEPTASIDPIEEKELYRLFKNMSRGRTTVIVTHRLAAARIADRILVLQDGRLAESGTHAELLKRNGKYAEMFRLQKGMYVQKNESEF